MHFLGIDWVGINAENGRKLLALNDLYHGRPARKLGLAIACWTALANLPDRVASILRIADHLADGRRTIRVTHRASSSELEA